MARNTINPDQSWTEPDRRPIPDPTALTTEQLLREIEALKSLIFMRLDGMDRAIVLLAEGVNRVPSETSKSIDHLKELVFTRFAERDLRIHQSAADSKDALAHARESAVTAIGKAEQALNKRFDIADAARVTLDERIRIMMPRSESESRHKAHDDQIANITSRLEAREERGKGMSQSWVLLTGAVMLIVAIVGILFTILKGTSS